MTNARFHYRGPANIDGVDFPNVTLAEDFREPGQELRSWSGTTSFPGAAAPAGFSANIGGDGAVTVRLPDGREGRLLVTATSFNGQTWTLDLAGTGTPPALP
ncbi:hypothetical protein [Streptomyces sp. NPDC090026]|uniref:hypothetical protein n=1 Tax=Streptomyces sp. NPDC090026 TaxID=3365923 RepID=UPI00380AEEFF